MRWLVKGMLPGLIIIFLAGAVARAEGVTSPAACQAGAWLDPASGTRIGHAAVLAKAAARGVVLLGETHDNAEHHRWQLATIAGLLAQGRPMVLGFEAFPRRVQPVLDRWSAGEMEAQAFLEAVDWGEVWGFDPNLYLPLFHFARMHHVPMMALNVDRALVARVGDEGWAAVPSDERAGLGDPAAPTGPYLDRLARSFVQHDDRRDGDAADDRQAVRERPAFKRFVEAQLTWDRAMAEALAEARRREGDPLVVGIIGSEHLRYGHGVPHQLADLGLSGSVVLLPEEVDRCTEVTAGLADAIFLLRILPRVERARPRLGVLLAAEAGEIRLTRVMENSIAKAAGLMAGDVIVQAAGRAIRRQRDLVEIVERQAPGTWLPLLVRRDKQTMEIVAKFPAEAGGGS